MLINCTSSVSYYSLAEHDISVSRGNYSYPPPHIINLINVLCLHLDIKCVIIVGHNCPNNIRYACYEFKVHPWITASGFSVSPPEHGRETSVGGHTCSASKPYLFPSYFKRHLVVTLLRMWKSFFFFMKDIRPSSSAPQTGPLLLDPTYPKSSFNGFSENRSPSITKEMSIETLLEAAKFLELQAQQQQKARGKRNVQGIVTLMHFLLLL